MKKDLEVQTQSRRSFLWNAILAVNGLGVRLAFGENSSATLDLKVYDSATGQSIPCSVALRTSDGTLITQHPGYRSGVRSSGEFRSAVPDGKIKLVITRGFDYQAEERELLLEPGKTTKCVVQLVRISWLRNDGWVCGDNHVHMKHGEGPIHVEFPFVALSARSVALDYMSIAQRWNVAVVTPEILSQECAAVSNPDCMLHWNMEAPKNYWKGDVSHCMGHGWTLGMRDKAPNGSDPIAELFAMSAGDYQKEKVPTPNFESHAYIHATGGIVSYTHPCRIWRGEWGGKNGFPLEEDKFVSNMAQELPFDTVAGPTYDCIDIMMQTKERLVNELGEQLWFMLLNQGYRLAATASTDASFDNPGAAVPGAVRVYTRIQGALTLDKVAAAMKFGKNFVTSGPLLEFSIDHNNIGDVIPVSADAKHHAHIRAWASGVPEEHLTKVEVIRNGQLYKRYELEGRPKKHEVELDIAENATAWYIVKCFGATSDQIAISNPIYFEDSKYRAPEAAMATVEIKVSKAGSSEPLTGVYEIVQMIGREPQILSTGAVEGGTATVSAPATARIRIKVDGYETQMKSIFIDTPELLKLTTEIQPAQMLEWETYTNIRTMLKAIRFNYEMQANA